VQTVRDGRPGHGHRPGPEHRQASRRYFKGHRRSARVRRFTVSPAPNGTRSPNGGNTGGRKPSPNWAGRFSWKCWATSPNPTAGAAGSM
jgi:hypothetical protein